MIKLVPFNECYKEVYDLYNDIPKEEVGSINHFYGLSRGDYLTNCKEYLKDIDTKRYILFDNDNPVGELGIRTTINDYWVNKGSQIYYKIRLSERNKGYGNLILKFGLMEARKLGFKKIRINCNDNNIASKKVIQNNGGILDIASYPTEKGTSSSYVITL